MEVWGDKPMRDIVAVRYASAYCGRLDFEYPFGLPRAKLEAIQALPADVASDEIDTVMGNGTWTRQWCCACRDHVRRAIIIEGDDLICICLDCIKKAASMLEDGVR